MDRVFERDIFAGKISRETNRLTAPASGQSQNEAFFNQRSEFENLVDSIRRNWIYYFASASHRPGERGSLTE